MSSHFEYGIRPQQKYYRGRKHRSYLELLWHRFFFRTMVGTVEYEPETYVSRAGELWLPDLRLTFDDPGCSEKAKEHYTVLVEIKPFRSGDSMVSEEVDRLEQFYKSGSEDIWLLGIPHKSDMWSSHMDVGFTFDRALLPAPEKREWELYTDRLIFGLSTQEGNYRRPGNCVYAGEETMIYDRWAYPLKEGGSFKNEMGHLIKYGRNFPS